MGLVGAVLYVKNFPRMKVFYQQMLGSQPVNTEWIDTWALFDTGSTRFSLHAIPTQIAQSIAISDPPEARESSPVKLIFAVGNVPEERKRLEAMGITIVQRLWQNAAEECDGVDPEGNIFQISSARQ
jgi:predicted enzyme related to lactoylglutathione lyase